MGRSAGSAAAGGFNFQAAAIALAYVHVLTGQPLNWLLDLSDVPRVVEAETGGPGDDLRVVCGDGTRIEVQVKKGLSADNRLWDAMCELALGLEKDPSLYAVLFVDFEASGSVKHDLRRAISRVTQGWQDDLKSTTGQLARKLKEKLKEKAGVENLTVLERLNIVVRDLYETADGHSSALTLLRYVTDDPVRAWRELELDGHRLMQERGGRNAEKLARLLSVAGVPLSPRAAEPAVNAQAYRDWLLRKTEDFYVPGPGIRLPIDKAWAELNARAGSGKSGPAEAKELEEWVSSYNEWGRLAAPRERTETDNTFEADLIGMAGDRVVVVGGPGSGKSTLQTRLAHRFSKLGRTVVRLSLAGVPERLRNGATLRNVLLDLAVGNSDLDREKAETILDHPDYLLADGLDECDPDRASVASQLHDWAVGRPNTRVIVTTRPVGHDPNMLPGWRHVDLLPLDEDGSRAHATNVLEVMYRNRERAVEHAEAFRRSLEGNDTAEKASRNPLLLGFLVQLYADGVPLARHRAQLYGQIVRLIRDRPGRSERPAESPPDSAVAGYVLEVAGWLLQNRSVMSRDELIDKLGEKLSPALECPLLAAKGTADTCLAFWQERGILDRVTAGTREAVMFVHPTLREYTAGSYASGFDGELLRSWVTEVRRDASWREPLLLAAGAGAGGKIVESLLDLYDARDLSGEELELAARALPEMPEMRADLTARVAKCVAERLTSDIPTLVFGAAESALGMTREAPGVVAPVLKPLAHHQQFATRVAAVRILLECGAEHTDPDALQRAIEELIGPNEGEHYLPQRRGLFVWPVQGEIMCRGTQQLLELRTGTEAAELAERVVLEGEMGSGHLWKLIGHLANEGYEEIAEKARKEHSFFRQIDLFRDLAALRRSNEEEIDDDRKFLRLVLDAADGSENDASDTLQANKAQALAALARGLELGDFPVGSWASMIREYDPAAVRVVFRGGIIAAGVETRQLAREAAGLLKHLDRVDPEHGFYFGLLGNIPKVPVSSQWERVGEAGLPAEDLVSALRHPSEAIAINAARLIAYGGGQPEAKGKIVGVLDEAPEHTYRAVAQLADYVWGEEETLENLLPALRRGVTADNFWLLLAVAKLPIAVDDERAAVVLLEGLRFGDPNVAATLAKKMNKAEDSEYPLFQKLTPRLEAVLEYWTARGTTCKKHGGAIYGDHCFKCYPEDSLVKTVLPSPREALVRQLGEAGLLTLDQLVELCNDQREDVKQTAARLVATKATEENAIPDLLARVDSGELPDDVLREIVALPTEALRLAKDDLVGLLASKSAPIREMITGALARGGWMNPVEAEALASGVLGDDDLGVRDRAAETLRTLGDRAE